MFNKMRLKKCSCKPYYFQIQKIKNHFFPIPGQYSRLVSNEPVEKSSLMRQDVIEVWNGLQFNWESEILKSTTTAS